MARNLSAVGLRLTDQHCRRELDCRGLAGRGIGGRKQRAFTVVDWWCSTKCIREGGSIDACEHKEPNRTANAMAAWDRCLGGGFAYGEVEQRQRHAGKAGWQEFRSHFWLRAQIEC